MRAVLGTAALAALTLVLTACGPAVPPYQDRVRPLGPESAHPLLLQVLPLLEHPGTRRPDDLIRTWKQFLGGTPVPLQAGTAFTFVYYDFTGTLTQVRLEASFAAGRTEALRRWGGTGLFYRTYEIPKPAGVHYRYRSGAQALTDPFQPAFDPAGGGWHPLLGPDPAEASLQHVVGAAEPDLAGQDLQVLLPPGFARNLAQVYPLVLVVGLDDAGWAQGPAALLAGTGLRPFVVATLIPSGPDGTDLRATLEDRVLPWLRRQYRVSALASDLTLVGWGAWAKAVPALATARPDLWPRVWVPAPDAAPPVWSSAGVAYLKSQFTVATTVKAVP